MLIARSVPARAGVLEAVVVTGCQLQRSGRREADSLSDQLGVDELGDESRQREEVLSDLDAQVERARELSGLIDQDLEGAEAVLRSPNPTE